MNSDKLSWNAFIVGLQKFFEAYQAYPEIIYCKENEWKRVRYVLSAAVCCILCAVCLSMLYLMCCMLQHMLYSMRCMLYIMCCMLLATCCILCMLQYAVYYVLYATVYSLLIYVLYAAEHVFIMCCMLQHVVHYALYAAGVRARLPSFARKWEKAVNESVDGRNKYYYASPSSGEAYRDRQLTTNLELKFFVCRHVSLWGFQNRVCLSVHLSVPQEKKSP